MKPTFLLLCLLALFLVSAAPAQDAATTPTLPIRVAFVDTEVILGESVAVRRIMSEIDKQLVAAEEEINAKKREARRLRVALDQQSAVLSEKERLTRQQEIIDMLASVDELEFRFNQRFREAQRGAVEPLLAEIIRVVGEVARLEKYDIVLRGELVLYGRDSVDLTPSVIRSLDSQEDKLRELLLTPEKSAAEEDKGEFNVLPLVP